MKIRLIQPSSLDEKGAPIRYRKLFMPFLSMATLAGLTPPDVDVGITEDFVEDIDYDEKVDLVGGIHATAALFGVAGVDLGTNVQLVRRRQGLAVAASALVNLFVGTREAATIRVYPELGLHGICDPVYDHEF